jgi:hypothetical protein
MSAAHLLIGVPPVTPTHLAAYWKAVEQELIDAHQFDPQRAAVQVRDLATKMQAAGPTVLNDEPSKVAEWLADVPDDAATSGATGYRVAGS